MEQQRLWFTGEAVPSDVRTVPINAIDLTKLADRSAISEQVQCQHPNWAIYDHPLLEMATSSITQRTFRACRSCLKTETVQPTSPPAAPPNMTVRVLGDLLEIESFKERF